MQAEKRKNGGRKRTYEFWRVEVRCLIVVAGLGRTVVRMWLVQVQGQSHGKYLGLTLYLGILPYIHGFMHKIATIGVVKVTLDSR